MNIKNLFKSLYLWSTNDRSEPYVIHGDVSDDLEILRPTIITGKLLEGAKITSVKPHNLIVKGGTEAGVIVNIEGGFKTPFIGDYNTIYAKSIIAEKAGDYVNVQAYGKNQKIKIGEYGVDFKVGYVPEEQRENPTKNPEKKQDNAVIKIYDDIREDLQLTGETIIFGKIHDGMAVTSDNSQHHLSVNETGRNVFINIKGTFDTKHIGDNNKVFAQAIDADSAGNGVFIISSGDGKAGEVNIRKTGGNLAVESSNNNSLIIINEELIDKPFYPHTEAAQEQKPQSENTQIIKSGKIPTGKVPSFAEREKSSDSPSSKKQRLAKMLEQGGVSTAQVKSNIKKEPFQR